MFESEPSTPWYRSIAVVVASALLIPPAALALFWIRKDWAARTKIVGTLAVVLIAVSYVYVFKLVRRSSANEAHYAALEQHRAQQQAAGQQAATANPAAQTAPAAATNPAQPNADPNAAAQTNETASAHAGRNYWTDFRGPTAQGHAGERGLPLTWSETENIAWKQPVPGRGWAGKAFRKGELCRWPGDDRDSCTVEKS